MLRAQATFIISFEPVSTGIGDQPMRMFETAASSVLAIVAQALVVGVVVTAF
jgi:hypothetical protein